MTKRYINNFLKYMRTKFPSLSAFEKLWLLAPVAVWFSYRPLIRFGENSSMYFELSVAVVYMALLAIVGIPIIWRSKSELIKSRAAQLAAGFVLISGISLLWTENLTRGVLTFGIIGALFAVFLASLVMSRQLQKLLPQLWSVLLFSAAVMSVLSLVQLIAGIWLDSNVTLLCRGCTPSQFGFARPNVFAIEPQFLGNLLLAPAIVLFHKFQKKQISTYEKVGFMVVSTALFLTLSRGAIYAFSIGAAVLILMNLKNLKQLIKPAGYLVCSFIVGLAIQGAAAAASPDLNATFKGAVSASINQLSLGVVDFRSKSEAITSVQQTDKKSDAKAQNKNDIVSETKEVDPNFNGYVEESTDVRLSLSRLALESWADGPRRIVFGVGLGASGDVLHHEYPQKVNQREIIQNEYIEVLHENGLIGLGLFISLVGLLFYALRIEKWAWALVIAYLTQWNFFSGYPNALHIYLLFIVLAVAIGGRLSKSESEA